MKKITLSIIAIIAIITASLLLINQNKAKGKQSKNHPNHNTPPKAKHETFTLDEDTKTYIALKATDEDNDTIGYRVSKQPKHGKLKGKANELLTYIPNKDYNGKDSFSFIANDGSDDSSETAIELNINPVNDAPIAKDDKVSLDEDHNITIDVLANDSDVDEADKLTITSITTPQNAKATILNNKIIYQPNPNYNGKDSFSYTIKDKAGAKATASVDIDIAPVNDAPVAKDDNLTTKSPSVLIDVLKNDTDIDGDHLTLQAITQQPIHGKASIENNKIKYVVDNLYIGKDTLTYSIHDVHGVKSKARVAIEIENSQQDMGMLQKLDDDAFGDARYATIHLYALYNEAPSNVNMLKLCNPKKCWDIIDKDHPLSLSHEYEVSSEQKTSLIKKMIFKDDNESIDRIIYEYKGKKGVSMFKDKVYFIKSSVNAMFLSFKNNSIKNYLTSMVPPYEYYLLTKDKKQVINTHNGLILEKNENSIASPALISVFFKKTATQSFSCNIWLASFSLHSKQQKRKFLQDIDKKEFPQVTLNKQINIYIPIHLENISEDNFKKNYYLEINGKNKDYNIDYIDDKAYIVVEINSSENNLELYNKSQKGI